MSTKPCVEEGCAEPKRAGHPRWCLEHWLMRQPVQVRVTAAQTRLELVAPQHRVSRVVPRHWPPGRRWCSGCQTFVLLEDTTGSRCSACASAAAHRSMVKATYTLRGRPFTGEDYDRLVKLQGGRCAICRNQQRIQRLAVDHDHKTGDVRGLLCLRCNHEFLGAVGDSLDLLRSAVAYLERPPASTLD